MKEPFDEVLYKKRKIFSTFLFLTSMWHQLLTRIKSRRKEFFFISSFSFFSFFFSSLFFFVTFFRVSLFESAYVKAHPKILVVISLLFLFAIVLFLIFCHFGNNSTICKIKLGFCCTEIIMLKRKKWGIYFSN